MNDESLPVALLVGGDMPMRAMVRFLLEGDGYTVRETGDAGAPPPLPRGATLAIVVLIAGERESETLGELGKLRRLWPRTPMILLSRDVHLGLRRGAFALGVPDIVPLPIDPQDLRGRLRAVLGASAMASCTVDQAGRETVRAGGLLLNTSTYRVADGNGWAMRLTRHESTLLAALMATPGQVVAHQVLVDRLWGGEERGGANALAVHVRRLRAKLAHKGRAHGYIRTAHGQGYVFDARSSPRSDEWQAVETEERREVLVVDDDRATLDMLTDVLRVAGYMVTCGAGPQAPTLARQTLPTVILLDINMPGMDGIEVRQHLRKSPRTATIPVIALSAGGNLRLRAKEMGADDYLAKPFSTDELLLRVEKWAGRAQ